MTSPSRKPTARGSPATASRTRRSASGCSPASTRSLTTCARCSPSSTSPRATQSDGCSPTGADITGLAQPAEEPGHPDHLLSLRWGCLWPLTMLAAIRLPGVGALRRRIGMAIPPSTAGQLHGQGLRKRHATDTSLPVRTTTSDRAKRRQLHSPGGERAGVLDHKTPRHRRCRSTTGSSSGCRAWQVLAQAHRWRLQQAAGPVGRGIESNSRRSGVRRAPCAYRNGRHLDPRPAALLAKGQ